MTDDRQRSKVYAWEERFVASCDRSSIAFAQAQGMVDGTTISAKGRGSSPPGQLHGGRRQSSVNPVDGYQPVVVAVARTRP